MNIWDRIKAGLVLATQFSPAIVQALLTGRAQIKAVRVEYKKVLWIEGAKDGSNDIVVRVE